MTDFSFPFEDRFFSDEALNCREPIIFHYTNGAGALGIVTSGHLWCSLAYQMNDKQECRYAHQVATSRAYSLLRKADAAHRAKFIEEFKSQLERISRAHIYAACFSDAPDLLSQWRGYSGLAGYALGFSLEALRKISPSRQFQLAPVKYRHDEHLADLDPIILPLLDRYDASAADREKIDELFWPSIQQIADKSAVIKHAAFSEEREWRLYSIPFSNSYERNDFIVRNDRILPICKFDLDAGTKTVRNSVLKDICLRSFRVGPGPDQEDRAEAMHAVIRRNKIYWQLASRSTVPLR